MNSKKIIKIILIGFVVVSIGYILFSYAENNGKKPQTQTEQTSNSETASAPENQTSLNSDSGSICGANDPGCEKQSQPERYVIAYYFHGTHRCYTCLTIEQYAKEAIESGFRNELQSGRLKFFSVNVEEPGNRHFIQDYQLYTRSLILVKMENGKQKQWKNLENIWTYFRDKPAFINYVQTEIREALKG